MQSIRRLYLYTVALVSLEVVLWGSIGLARLVFTGEELGSSTSRLAESLSFTLVAVPVFLIHWLLAQRGATLHPEERFARLRALFLYGTLLATLVPVAQNGMAVLSRSLLAAFNLDPWQALAGGGQTLSDNLVAIALNGFVAAYFFNTLRLNWQAALADEDAQQPPIKPGEEFLETRRLYRYLWMLYGLAMVIFGVQQVVKFILSTAESVGSGRLVLLANGLTLILLGTPLWVFIWRVIQQSLSQPAEATSTMRMTVLFGLALSGMLTVLFAAIRILQIILRVALGESDTQATVLANLLNPLSIAIPLGGAWAYYRRILRYEIDALQESSRRGRLNRLYDYALTIAGFVAMFLGLQMLLAFLLDITLSGQAVWGNVLRQNLAAALAALTVGLPVWLTNWRSLSREAAQENEAGDHARRSLIRRGTLYLALFAGVMGVMFSAGAMLYRLLSSALGSPPQNLLLESLQLFKIMLLFALLLAYHWHVLRDDNRLAERLLAKRHARYPILILAPEEAEFAEHIADALHREAPAISLAIHPISQGGPGQDLLAAKAVIFPIGLLANPPEAIRLWLQEFNGERLAIPLPTGRWRWVGSTGVSMRHLARQAARMARHLAEGDELPRSPEASPWLIVAYVFAGLFALQLLIGLVGIGISMLNR
jgi:hypothetical protein